MKKLNKKIMTLMAGAFVALGISSCSQYDDVGPVQEAPKAEFVMPENAVVLAEQSRTAILVMDMNTKQVVWEWEPLTGGIPSAKRSLFKNPSECKPVLNNEYVLMTASGGAVALIRFADKKVMCYAECGINPHSAEILPDGNIVTAESKQGEINLFAVDMEKGTMVKKSAKKIGNAHNLVWDAKRQCIYTTGTINDAGKSVTALFRFKYNNDKENPALTNQARIYTFDNEKGGHDLFPVYGETDKLWLTAEHGVYQFDMSAAQLAATTIYEVADVKAVGKDAQGNDYLLKPTESWWAPCVVDGAGNEYFNLASSKIYKFRLVQDNQFSYQ